MYPTASHPSLESKLGLCSERPETTTWAMASPIVFMPHHACAYGKRNKYQSSAWLEVLLHFDIRWGWVASSVCTPATLTPIRKSAYTSSCSEFNGKGKNPAPARKWNHKFRYAASHFVWLPPIPFPVTSELSCRTFSKLWFYSALKRSSCQWSSLCCSLCVFFHLGWCISSGNQI